MAQQQLSPSAIVTQFNISGSIGDVQDNPYAPDDKYMKNPSGFGIAVFDFPAGYPLELGPIQKFIVFVRNPSNSISTINISVLDENMQAEVKASGSIDIPRQSQMVIEMTWDANALSIKRSENVRIGTTINGALDLGAVMWIAEVYQPETTAIMVQTRRVIVTHGYYQAQTRRAVEKLLAYSAQTVRRTGMREELVIQAARKLVEAAVYSAQSRRSLSSTISTSAQTQRKTSRFFQELTQTIRRIGTGARVETQTSRKVSILAVFVAQSRRRLTAFVKRQSQTARRLFGKLVRTTVQTLRNLLLGKPNVYIDFSVSVRPVDFETAVRPVEIEAKERTVTFEVR